MITGSLAYMSAKAVPLLGAEKNSLALRFPQISTQLSYKDAKFQKRISMFLRSATRSFPALCELGSRRYCVLAARFPYVFWVGKCKRGQIKTHSVEWICRVCVIPYCAVHFLVFLQPT
jgi:hypothetical protein